MRKELTDKLLLDAEECKMDFTENDYIPTINDIPFYFVEGAKWLLNNLWHPVGEQPIEKKPLLLEKTNDNGYSSYIIAQFIDGRVKWNGVHECRLKLFNRYCYIEDLLSAEAIVSSDNQKEDAAVSTDDSKFLLKNTKNGMTAIVTNLVLDMRYDKIPTVISTGTFFAEDIADVSRTLNYSCWENQAQMKNDNQLIEVYVIKSSLEHVADLFNVTVQQVDFDTKKFEISFDYQLFYSGTEFGDKYNLKIALKD